jgi:hypothetical protein
VSIGTLVRAPDGLSCLKKPGLCTSQYNANYSCSVDHVSTDGMYVRVGFTVTGDGSLGDLQHPSECNLRLIQDKKVLDPPFLFSDKSRFEFSSNASSGTLVFELPALLQAPNDSSNVPSTLSRYLSAPYPNAAVTRAFSLWLSVALAKLCRDLVAALLSSGSLFNLLLLLDSVEQSETCNLEHSSDSVDAKQVVLAIIAKLRQDNKRVPVASFFQEVIEAVASGKERSATCVDFANALLSVAAPAAFILSRRALSIMNSLLHSCTLSSLPAACLVTLPDWVSNASSLQSCVFLPLFFAGRPVIVMPNFGWADFLVGGSQKRISIPCACVMAALLSSGACMTVSQLSDETGLPQPAVSECIKLLLMQNACVSVSASTGESYRLQDAALWSADGWVVINHSSLKASCSFFGLEYAAVCHWFGLCYQPCEFPEYDKSFRYAISFSSAPVLDFCESVCECSHCLSLPHAQVTYAVSRMSQERVLALSRGYVCEFSRFSSINFSSLPPSSLAACTERSNLLYLTGPLSFFQRLVLVAPEASMTNEPFPYSNSFTAAVTLTPPDLKAEISKTVLSIAKKIGRDCAQISGDALFCSCACPASDFVTHFPAAVMSVEGSFARAIFKIVHSPVDCAVAVSIETQTGFCSLCMEDDEMLILAPCGHGFCRICWQGYVSTAIVDGSTTKVKQGVEDLLDVSMLQCPGCTSEDKYQGPNPAPFLTLAFAQAICPPATSRTFSARVCDQLASKFLRSNLPGSLCSCGAAIVGMSQVKHLSSDCDPLPSLHFFEISVELQPSNCIRKMSSFAVAACVYQQLAT